MLREKLPDEGEDARVGGGVGARRAADGRLVDVDHPVYRLEAGDGPVLLRPAPCDR